MTVQDSHGRPCAHALLIAGLFVLAMLFATGTCGAERAPAPYITQLIPGAQTVGTGRLTWLGFHAYDAALYAGEARYEDGKPFALGLTYARKFKGAAIAERSISEIRKLGLAQDQELTQWQVTLGNIFPDIEPGDQLTGVSLGGGALRFFHNGRAIGTVNDEALRHAFFSIWLDPRTSAPELRRKLLGDTGAK